VVKLGSRSDIVIGNVLRDDLSTHSTIELSIHIVIGHYFYLLVNALISTNYILRLNNILHIRSGCYILYVGSGYFILNVLCLDYWPIFYRGFSPQFLLNRGFSPQFILKRGFSPQFLLNRGFSPQFIQNRGFSHQFLLNRGFYPQFLLLNVG